MIFWIRILLIYSIAGFGVGLAQNKHTEVSRLPSRFQTTFSAEDQTVKHPVTLPRDVLSILRGDNYVQSCLSANQSVDQIPASWFSASAVHLTESSIDLVVIPKNKCLSGANIGPFWVFRKAAKAYDLVLDVSAHDLEILNTKSNGYRNIRIYSATAGTMSTVLFRFDGRKYQEYQSRMNPIR